MTIETEPSAVAAEEVVKKENNKRNKTEKVNSTKLLMKIHHLLKL